MPTRIVAALLVAAATATPASAACRASGSAGPVRTPAGEAGAAFWYDESVDDGEFAGAGVTVAAGGRSVSWSHQETREPGPGLVEQLTGWTSSGPSAPS